MVDIATLKVGDRVRVIFSDPNYKGKAGEVVYINPILNHPIRVAFDDGYTLTYSPDWLELVTPPRVTAETVTRTEVVAVTVKLTAAEARAVAHLLRGNQHFISPVLIDWANDIAAEIEAALGGTA